MKREVVLNKWAKILYYWSMQAGVDIGAITEDEIPEWDDYPTDKQKQFYELAKKLWQEVG